MDNFLKFYNWRFWLILYLLTIGLAYYFLPPQIPLYYFSALKADRLSPPYMLFILPTYIILLYILAKLLIDKLSLLNLSMQLLIKSALVMICLITYLVLLRIIILVI